MQFDLTDLIAPYDLECLVTSFTHDEIDAVIKQMPVDKSPGPDGFNGMFLKKCWSVIKEYFYALCEEFYNGTVDLVSINSSFITLTSKIQNPKNVNDYRPISLLNCSIKILTKLLAERLQMVILRLIHVNQYGFIKTRTIQDCLAWSFDYIHQCHHSKREILILKLYFAKAFDIVEHSAMLAVMTSMGFPQRWLTWMKMLFSSANSAVLLNGVPGKQFKCLRGVGQGDPLSPLLFILAAELLQVVINRGFRDGVLSAPLPQAHPDFPIIQYADDTLMIMKADSSQLLALKDILNTFTESTGLKVNYSKSQIARQKF